MITSVPQKPATQAWVLRLIYLMVETMHVVGPQKCHFLNQYGPLQISNELPALALPLSAKTPEVQVDSTSDFKR